MFDTEDNYNLYYDGVISGDQEEEFEQLIKKYQLQPDFINLIKQHHNFVIHNSFNMHRILLWGLYQVLRSYAITIFFAETEHPHGCEYQSKIDFFVGTNGRFDYELKNSLYIHGDNNPSDECEERIEQESIGFDKDCRVRSDIRAMDLNVFVDSIR